MAQYVTLVYTLPRIAGAITAAAPPSPQVEASAYRRARDGATTARYAHGYEASRYGL